MHRSFILPWHSNSHRKKHKSVCLAQNFSLVLELWPHRNTGSTFRVLALHMVMCSECLGPQNNHVWIRFCSHESQRGKQLLAFDSSQAVLYWFQLALSLCPPTQTSWRPGMGYWGTGIFIQSSIKFIPDFAAIFQPKIVMKFYFKILGIFIFRTFTAITF